MEEYLQSLQKQLKSFAPDEQAALLEEIKSHVESGENDPAIGKDQEQRRKTLINELGSPQDISKGFKAVYRPGRLLDYLLVVIPYALYPFLSSLYMELRPQHSWIDVRIDILIHLPLIAVGLWRRSPLVTLFWITMITTQLLYITTQGYWLHYWYYGIQTILWAVLLLGLLCLFAVIVWKNRHDLLVVVYAAIPFCMLVLGNFLTIFHPTSYTAYNFLDRSLLSMFLDIRNLTFYAPFVTMALFFLPANRNIRWMALVISGLVIGLGRDYMMDWQTGSLGLMATWVYPIWAILPVIIVLLGWRLERINNRQLQLAT